MVGVIKIVRRVATVALVLPALGIIQDVAGEWFIEYARERGAYERPTERMAAIMNAMSVVTDAWWFPWIGGVIIGFAVGTWLDAILRRWTLPQGANPKTATERPSDAAPPPSAEKPKRGEIPLEPFRHRVFTNEKIVIDGKSFIGCTFHNIKFEYNGGDYEIGHCSFFPAPIFTTQNEAVSGAVNLMYQLAANEIKIVDEYGNPRERSTTVMTPEEFIKK